jgi:hypothetical protein
VRPCGRGEARERERGGVRVPLPHCGASTAADGGEGMVERQRDVRPKLINGMRRRSSGCYGFTAGGGGCGLGIARARATVAEPLGVRARGGARVRRRRDGRGLEPESGSRLGMTLAGGPQLSAEERGEGKEGPACGRIGPGGKVAGPRGKKERGGERPPNWAVGKRKEGRLGWAAREKWERKKKKESGPGPTRK